MGTSLAAASCGLPADGANATDPVDAQDAATSDADARDDVDLGAEAAATTDGDEASDGGAPADADADEAGWQPTK